MYDVQYPDRTVANDRGRVIGEDDGFFCYRGILPTAYPIVRIFNIFAIAKTKT